MGGYLSTNVDNKPDPNNPEEEVPVMYYKDNVSRIFYDGLYNMIIVIILSSVVAGIIIDTFGALRA